METVEFDHAQANLCQLINRAAGGEQIIIVKAGRPVARLVPLVDRTTPRPLGPLAGKLVLGPDFDDPLPDGMLAAFGGRTP